MKKLTLLLLLGALLSLAIHGVVSPLIHAPIAADPAINQTGTLFKTAWIYDSPAAAFTNSQVVGRKWWQASVRNAPDPTGAPVSALALALESTRVFENVSQENLETQGPPLYEWSFGDVPDGSGADAWVDAISDPVPITFSPGFDASRSADKTEFSGPDTQTLTISVTPREVTEGFTILVQAEENDTVSPIITSPTSGDGVTLTPDGRSLHISPTDLQLNATWTVTVTVEVTPKVRQIEFTPYVMVGWEGEALASGTASGSSLSRPVGDPRDEVGTWTWSAEGSYEWLWEERLSQHVTWVSSYGVAGEVREGAVSTPEEAGNRIYLGFFDEFTYEVSGNTFVNQEVIGKRWWRTNFANWPDETGAPVTGLRVTLDTELDFDEVESDKLTRMGPPAYEWHLGDVVEEPERQGWGWDAFVGLYGFPEGFSPGLDVSRSFDKTSFTAPGTQTMALTLTPREEWVETVTIFVHTDEYDTVNAVILSISHGGGGQVDIMEEGHRSGIGRIPVELNTPLTITYTLQIMPKVSQVEYSPYTSILLYRPGLLARGTQTGSSVSYANEAGTWTWSAEGDYVWLWGAETPDYTVTFLASVEPPVPDHAPVPGPPPAPGQAISWQQVVGIAAAVVIAGGGIYFFARRRLARRSTPS